MGDEVRAAGMRSGEQGVTSGQLGMTSGRHLPFPRLPCAPQQGGGDSGDPGTQRYQRVPAQRGREERGPSAAQPSRPTTSPTSFLLSPEELSSLETNSLLLKLSLMFLAGDLVEDEDLEAAPFFSTFPFVCFSCFFFFFLDLSLHALGGRKGEEKRHPADSPPPSQGRPSHPPAPERPRHRDGRGRASPATPQPTHALELSDLLPTLYSFMAFS